jgi:hypothetical protein
MISATIHKLLLPAAMLAASVATYGAVAQGTGNVPPDKSQYNLFQPVPENLMRDLSPDRTDATESTYTVDAGHYQLEMDFANFTYDQNGGTTTKAWDVGNFNFKIGLLNNVDLQLGYENYLNVQTEDSLGHSTTQSGFGDVVTRLKINLWGNDGGKTAFALLPFVKFPTATDNPGNHAIEGGVIFPFAVSLPCNFDLSMETSGGVSQNSDDGDYYEETILSASARHQLFGSFSGFLEFASNFRTEPHSASVVTADTGMEYEASKNIMFIGTATLASSPPLPITTRSRESPGGFE